MPPKRTHYSTGHLLATPLEPSQNRTEFVRCTRMQHCRCSLRSSFGCPHRLDDLTLARSLVSVWGALAKGWALWTRWWLSAARVTLVFKFPRRRWVRRLSVLSAARCLHSPPLSLWLSLSPYRCRKPARWC